METKQTAAFFVGDIPVFGDLILAPMDGVSDLPFRSLVRRLGSAMSYTEFINARDVLEGHPHLPRRLSYLEFERPVVFQVFDDDPARMLAAAQRLLDHQPDIIDVNLGCSAKTVTSRGAGAALLRDPRKIARIISSLSASLPVPVTAKIRLGWDEGTQNYLQVARVIEENGGRLIAVHGRTKQQAYSGEANWDAIAEIKQAVSIPVIANGDVRSIQDIERIVARTGCDAAMIGRAAIGNPWIFSRRELKDIPIVNVTAELTGLLESMLAYYGEERGVLLFRKHLKRILTGLEVPGETIKDLITFPSAAQVQARIMNLFADWPA